MRRKPHKMSSSHRRFRPDNVAAKIKNAAASRDKYLNLAREALGSGDRIEAESHYQHADHYYRVWAFLQEEDARGRAERQAQYAQQPNQPNGEELSPHGEDNRAGDSEENEGAEDEMLATA